MNSIVHFFTGYLVARGLKYRERRPECIVASVGAVLPDLDFLIGQVVPGFAHGVWTHTLVVAAGMALLWGTLCWAALRSSSLEMPNLWFHLAGIALLGTLSHLLLDSFTLYASAEDATHHLYFWPLWDFPVHINTIFPGATYEVRVWVEITYSIAVGTGILLVQWAWKKQNPLGMFDVRYWVVNPDPRAVVKFEGRPPTGIWALALGLLGVEVLNLAFGFVY